MYFPLHNSDKKRQIIKVGTYKLWVCIKSYELGCNAFELKAFLICTYIEIFSVCCESRLIFYYKYTIPIDLASIGIPIDAKSIGKSGLD